MSGRWADPLSLNVTVNARLSCRIGMNPDTSDWTEPILPNGTRFAARFIVYHPALLPPALH